LVFASYNTPGAHRLRLDDQRKAWLKFDSREMTLVNDGQQTDSQP
jgi:type VI secretion system protein